ncbi:MAG: hypothetical protein QOH58_1773 [Thermoleophilaceae bacterium]|jgi:hypothetical protein|nr:hypothetical protein [Thermoleophilaceae bacterium]
MNWEPEIRTSVRYSKVPGAPEPYPPVPDEVEVIALDDKVTFRRTSPPYDEFRLTKDDFRKVYDRADRGKAAGSYQQRGLTHLAGSRRRMAP